MAEEIETHQETLKKPSPKKFWRDLTWLEIGAIIMPILFILYLHNSTALILNFNNGNETRIIGGIPNPPNSVLYPPNAYVPKSSVSNSQTFFGIGIYLICVLVLLQKRLKEARRATPKEAMDEISKELKKLKNIPLADGTSIPITDAIQIDIHPHFMTRYKAVGDERKAFRYVFQVIVKDKNEEVPSYYRAWYHPWDWFWDGFYPAKTSLGDKDRCYYCGGTDYDEKIILADRLKEFRELRRGLTGFR